MVDININAPANYLVELTKSLAQWRYLIQLSQFVQVGDYWYLAFVVDDKPENLPSGEKAGFSVSLSETYTGELEAIEAEFYLYSFDLDGIEYRFEEQTDAVSKHVENELQSEFGGSATAEELKSLVISGIECAENQSW